MPTDRIVSQNGRFRTVFQNDGNVVTDDLATGQLVWDAMSGIYRPPDLSVPWPVEPPPVEPPTDPVPPTSDRRLVDADFCNLTDSTGRPIFSSCLAVQPIAMQEEWIARAVATGGTSYVLSVETGYATFTGPPEWGYGEVVHLYRSGRFDDLLAAIARIRRAGLRPTVMLDPGGTYPGAAFLRELTRAFPRDLYDVAQWVLAWEPVKGNWRSRELGEAARVVREALGPNATMLCHLSPERASGSSNPHEVDDPWDSDEVQFWYSNGGDEFDGFLYQSSVPRGNGHDPTNAWGSPSWQQRAIEVAERFLPPGTPMPGALGFPMEARDENDELLPARIHPGVAGYHSWFGATGHGRARGVPALTWFEATAYTFIRQQSTSEYAREIARWAQSVGFQAFGNGRP